MRLWIAHTSEVPIREQLTTQITLGILSGDLRKGQKLPSTRELAKRFRVHANTISAAYRELEIQGWLESRRGSGVFVRGDKGAKRKVPSALALDQHIAQLFRAAREAGFSLKEIRSHLRRWLTMQPPDHFLLIEPDEELRRIVVYEIRQAVEFPVEGADESACADLHALDGAIPIVLPSKAERVRQKLPEGTECLALKVRSVPASLAKWLPAKKDALVAVASRWPAFLVSARTMLLAAGFDADALILRDAAKPRWQAGLTSARALVCDSLTAQEVPRGLPAIVFPVVSEESLKELLAFRDFVTGPLR